MFIHSCLKHPQCRAGSIRGLFLPMRRHIFNSRDGANERWYGDDMTLNQFAIIALAVQVVAPMLIVWRFG